MPSVILSVNLDALSNLEQLPLIDITPVATKQRFRLIDCSQYVKHKTLSVIEFPSFPVPECSYAAISYVWRGNLAQRSDTGPTFAVAGAEDGDPIGVDVLHHACIAALQHGAEYIWLDRLCIIQRSDNGKDDKNQQIAWMFEIYRQCTICIVLPGGIQRLVGLCEHTTWIHRAWTLQEVLAPPRVEVLYCWRHGSGMYYRDGGSRGEIKELVPAESALMPFAQMLALYGPKPVNFFAAADGTHIIFKAEVFGLPHDSPSVPVVEQTTNVAVFLLKSAFEKYSSSPDKPLYFEERAPAIWRSAHFRASSRPVDMVFSIMGLFGVTLDTRSFRKDDRIGATIALMQAILRNGRRASWLGIAPYLPPDSCLSMLPIFPHTTVQGQVKFDPFALPKSELDGIPSRLAVLDTRRFPLPTGSMDEVGYFTLSRRAIRIYKYNYTNEKPLISCNDTDITDFENERLRLRAINGSTWMFSPDQMDLNTDDPKAFAVILGWYNHFSTNSHAHWEGSRHLGALLVKEHAPKKFHVVSSFLLNGRLERWVEGWQEHTLVIGGPAPGLYTFT